jgi:hypothetical protein
MPRTFRHWTPRYIANRLLYAWHQRSAPDDPWLTRRAVELLEDWISPNDVGLEWGSGRSTLWFAERTALLTSIEHNPAWHEWVNSRLVERGYRHVDYRLEPLDAAADKRMPRYVEAGVDGGEATVDFALVDGQLRDLCTEVAMSRLRPGGLLVIDNAEQYFPRLTHSPSSMLRTGREPSPRWVRLREDLARWRCVWTSNGVCDTALFAKPAAA